MMTAIRTRAVGQSMAFLLRDAGVFELTLCAALLAQAGSLVPWPGAGGPWKPGTPSWHRHAGLDVSHHICQGPQCRVVLSATSTFRRLCTPTRKFSQSIESRSTWSRSRSVVRDVVGLHLGGDRRQHREDLPANIVCRWSWSVHLSRSSGCCSNSLIAARNNAPRCPSLARWSAARVACTVVAMRMPPSIGAHPLCRLAETHHRDLRRVDHPEYRVDALVAQVGHGDGGIGHLRTAQRERPGAGHQIGEVGHQLVELLVGDVVDRRSHQTAAAQRNRHPDMDRRRGLEAVICARSR